jgi:hypothetical protein
LDLFAFKNKFSSRWQGQVIELKPAPVPLMEVSFAGRSTRTHVVLYAWLLSLRRVAGSCFLHENNANPN